MSALSWSRMGSAEALKRRFFSSYVARRCLHKTSFASREERSCKYSLVRARAKSVKVGAASAGKAARSRRSKDASASAVDASDAEFVEHLQGLRERLATAKTEAKWAEETLNMVRGLCAKYREHQEDEQKRAAELDRVAANDTAAYQAASASPEYHASCHAYHKASVTLEKETAATAKAACSLRDAEDVFRVYLNKSKSGFAHSDEVKRVMGTILQKVERGWSGEEDTSGVAVNAMPELKIALPERHGAYTVAPSKAGWAIVVAERKLAKEKKRQRAKEAAAAAAVAAGGGAEGATDTAPRRSTRSSRGKPAEVFDA